MKIHHRYYLGIVIISMLWGAASFAHADNAVRHHIQKPYSEERSQYHRYYDKAPRIIHRPLSSHRKLKHHRRHIPRHYRGESRHHPHIRRNRHGVYFSGYGFIPYGHHHHSRCPHWHYESFVLGLGLSIILNQ